MVSIQTDRVSLTETRVCFDYSRFFVKEGFFRQLVDWLNEDTDGSVIVDFSRLENGFVTVFYNPTMGGMETYYTVVDRIREIIREHEVFHIYE